MAYETPTVSELVTRYPAFAEVPVSTVELYIADALGAVDTSWLAGDYGPAVCAKAAHDMALLGLGSQSEAAGHVAAGVTSLRSGNFQVQFSADAVKSASKGGLDATPYGRAYKLLLKKNKGGPRVIARAGFAGPGPTDGYLP